MKTTITAAERLQLIGLLTLAESYIRKSTEVRDAVVELLDGRGDENVESHASDVVWDGVSPDADRLLDRLKITVQE